MLIHIEVEAEHRATFAARMAEYYMLLRLRRRLPVMPIVVYLAPGAGGLVQEVYTEAIFDHEVLRFTYDAIGLPDLQAEDYVAARQSAGTRSERVDAAGACREAGAEAAGDPAGIAE